MSLESDDEESSAHNEEEIVNSFKVTSKDKDTLLPSPKSKNLKHFINFVGLRFKWFFSDYLSPNIRHYVCLKTTFNSSTSFQPPWVFFNNIDVLKFVSNIKILIRKDE